MDLLSAMRSFRRIVELGSFSRASEDLSLSPAGLSKQIRLLEEHLGTVLLHRTTRRMSLTDPGSLYFAECCRILDQLEDLERKIQGSAQETPRAAARPRKEPARPREPLLRRVLPNPGSAGGPRTQHLGERNGDLGQAARERAHILRPAGGVAPAAGFHRSSPRAEDRPGPERPAPRCRRRRVRHLDPHTAGTPGLVPGGSPP